MKRSEFEKKQNDLQKRILNTIMDSKSTFDPDEIDVNNFHESSGLHANLFKNISDVLNHRKWGVISNAALLFCSESFENLAGLFPYFESDWLELNKIWYEYESGAVSNWDIEE